MPELELVPTAQSKDGTEREKSLRLLSMPCSMQGLLGARWQSMFASSVKALNLECPMLLSFDIGTKTKNKRGPINLRGLRQPTFGHPGERPVCCASCRDEGMVDVVSKRCRCGLRRPHFGYPGDRPRQTTFPSIQVTWPIAVQTRTTTIGGSG